MFRAGLSIWGLPGGNASLDALWFGVIAEPGGLGGSHTWALRTVGGLGAPHKHSRRMNTQVAKEEVLFLSPAPFNNNLSVSPGSSVVEH